MLYSCTNMATVGFKGLISTVTGFRPSHQNRIPDRFLNIPDGAGSIYHFSGRLHLPPHRPLATTFQCKYQLFSTYSVRTTAVFKYVTFFKLHVALRIHWHSLIFQKVGTLIQPKPYSTDCDNIHSNMPMDSTTSMSHNYDKNNVRYTIELNVRLTYSI